MNGSIIGFIIWVIVGFCIIGMGISSFFSKKTAGFWANIKTMPVNDVTRYNHAIGKLFILYGVIFIVLGMPLVSDQNTPYILLSVLGVVIETIAIMAIYSLFIEKKYRGK